MFKTRFKQNVPTRVRNLNVFATKYEMQLESFNVGINIIAAQLGRIIFVSAELDFCLVKTVLDTSSYSGYNLLVIILGIRCSTALGLLG